jgi:hypothetical protein
MPRHPSHRPRNWQQVSGDLGGGVSAADHQDALVGEG